VNPNALFLQPEFIKFDDRRLWIAGVKPIAADGACARIKNAEDGNIIAGNVGHGLLFGIKERGDRDLSG